MLLILKGVSLEVGYGEGGKVGQWVIDILIRFFFEG